MSLAKIENVKNSRKNGEKRDAFASLLINSSFQLLAEGCFVVAAVEGRAGHQHISAVFLAGFCDDQIHAAAIPDNFILPYFFGFLFRDHCRFIFFVIRKPSLTLFAKRKIFFRLRYCLFVPGEIADMTNHTALCRLRIPVLLSIRSAVPCLKPVIAVLAGRTILLCTIALILLTIDRFGTTVCTVRSVVHDSPPFPGFCLVYLPKKFFTSSCT